MARTFLRGASGGADFGAGAAASRHSAMANSASRPRARLLKPITGSCGPSLPPSSGSAGARPDDRRVLKRVVNRGQQRVFVEGLHEEPRRLMWRAAKERRTRVRGNEDGRQLVLVSRETPVQIDPRHPRHAYVEQDAVGCVHAEMIEELARRF